MEEECKDWLEISARYIRGELGNQGACDACGEWAGELKDGLCGPCDEKIKPEVK